MPSTVRTRSRVQMVYLRLFRHFHLNCKLMRPILIVGSFVFYQTTYVLSAS